MLHISGYEAFSDRVNVKDIVGSTRKLKEKNPQRNVVISGTTRQVNFYYYKENIVEVAEPQRTIEGSVFVEGEETKKVATSCSDTTQLKLNESTPSVPSGENVVVGVKGIPKYMLAAANVEYVNQEYTAGAYSVHFLMGEEIKSVYFDKKVKCNIGYYIVKDMALYKLNNVTIYDAGTSGTIGGSLFDWNEKQVMPKDMNLNVELIGKDGWPISKTDIDNVHNYVSTSYVDENGKTLADYNTIWYLDSDQLAAVDANGDGAVTTDDKTYSKNQLETYASILSEKQRAEVAVKGVYDTEVKNRGELENNYKEAEKRLGELKDEYDAATSNKNNKWTSVSQLTGEVNKLTGEIETLNQELEALKTEKDKAEDAKEKAESVLTAANEKADKLYKIYYDAELYRQEIEKQADCDDELPDKGNTMDMGQAEAAKACKEIKEKLKAQEQAVNDAFTAWDNYVQGDLTKASSESELKTKEYDDAVSAIAAKESEISTKKSELTKANITLSMAKLDYKFYVNNTFTPAKDAYDSYNENTYLPAKAAYDKNIEDKVVENAYSELENAQKATKDAQDDYNEYNTYRDNLLKKFDEYKRKYDEFMAIDENDEVATAKKLGLHLKVSVTNMSVNIKTGDGSIKIKSQNDSAYRTFKVEELLQKSNDTTQYEVAVKERPEVNKNLYSIIDTQKNNSTDGLLNLDDYENSSKIVNETTNGIRALAGKVEYKTEVVIGDEKDPKKIKDNVYYSDQSNNSNDNKVFVFNLKTTELEKTYNVKTSAENDEEKYKETKPVNVYTPITVSASLSSNDSQIVNQIKNQELKDSVIQLNVPFTITLNNEGTPIGYSEMKNTSKYGSGYYVRFDFDVHNVKINGRLYNSGNRVAAGTWIGLIEKDKPTITAQAYGNLEGDEHGVISESNSYYYVRAVAYNATQIIKNASFKYKGLGEMLAGDIKNDVYNICTRSESPSYFAQEQYPIIIVNRMYDFRITDIKDVNWKNVFRYNTSSNKNIHKGIMYYSGTKKVDTTSTKTNDTVNRTASEIGRNPLRILPVGPYKNTDSTYINAPKLGYRFSFDMKVTGSYYNEDKSVNTNKKVNIATKFYYISKDGKTYLPEHTGNDRGIYLFYKTSSGKYVRIGENSSDGYELRFTPNDGYRYLQSGSTATLSKTSVLLGDLRNLTLTHNMATVSSNGAVITYYGEYKLPNSTIAVEVDKFGNYDINKPLTNGYIGVVFDISSYAGEITIDDKPINVELSYSKDTKGEGTNTSQWDYEGFLGFTNSGSLVQPNNPLTLKLEKGTWKINNKVYNEIKGTVMLYDIDQRAATDYE